MIKFLIYFLQGEVGYIAKSANNLLFIIWIIDSLCARVTKKIPIWNFLVSIIAIFVEGNLTPLK